MKYLYFLLSLSLITFISCQSDRENQPASPSDINVEIIENAMFHDIINDNSHILTFQKYDSLSISFHREHKDSAWSSISFGRWPHKAFDNTDTINLSSYIKQLDSCWNYAARLGSINIKRLGLLTPQYYPDILKNQVTAFNKDELWKSKTTNDKISNNEIFGWIPSNNWAGNIMMNNDVYKPINDFLKQKGFKISWYALEKLIQISESKQKELGVDSVILVPSALAINIFVSKSNRDIGKTFHIPDTSIYKEYYDVFNYVHDNFKVVDSTKAFKKNIYADSTDETYSVNIDDNNPKSEECAWRTFYNKNIIYERDDCESQLQSIVFEGYSFEEVMRFMKIIAPREYYDYSNEGYLAEGWRFKGNNFAEYVLQLDCYFTVKGTDRIRLEYNCMVCNA